MRLPLASLFWGALHHQGLFYVLLAGGLPFQQSLYSECAQNGDAYGLCPHGYGIPPRGWIPVFQLVNLSWSDKSPQEQIPPSLGST